MEGINKVAAAEGRFAKSCLDYMKTITDNAKTEQGGETPNIKYNRKEEEQRRREDLFFDVVANFVQFTTSTHIDHSKATFAEFHHFLFLTINI